MPPDALGFVHIRLAELWETPFAKKARAQLVKEIAAADKEVVRRLGMPLAKIGRATVIVRSQKDDYPLIIVTTMQAYDRDKVLKAALPDAQEHRYKSKSYFTSKESGRAALCFLSSDRYLYGMVEDVVRQLNRDSPIVARGPLTGALELASKDHHVVAGFNVPENLVAEMKEQLANQGKNLSLDTALLQSFKPLLEVRSASLAIDFAKEADVRAQLVFATESEAKEALWPAKDGIALLRLLSGPLLGQFGKEIGARNTEAVLKPLESALRTAAIEQRDAMLHGSLHFAGDPAMLVNSLPALIQSSDQTIRSSTNRSNSVNRLRQLALAMHNYHDTHGSLPPAAIYSKDGKPLLSWRVAILPFIEQDNLYEQFKPDEPWDSAHNKALLKRMPATYDSPGPAAKQFSTIYQVFVGKSAVFDGKQGTRLSDITDGTSNTLMIAEAAAPVPWTKPEDLLFDPKKPLPKLGGLSSNGFNAAFCDGSVRFIKKSLKTETLRALITRDGGEVIDMNELNQ